MSLATTAPVTITLHSRIAIAQSFITSLHLWLCCVQSQYRVHWTRTREDD